MGRRNRPIVRIFGVALLLLAMSPVTAPFSTCDLLDLFDGATAPSGPSIHSKASPHEPASEVGRTSGFIPAETVTTLLLVTASLAGGRSSLLDVPLRI